MARTNMLGFIGSIGFGEMVLIGIIGLLIFGSSLPTVGRKLGRGLMEFKKGLRGIKDEIDDAMDHADAEAERSALDQDRKAGQEAADRTAQAALPGAGGQADASASAAAAGGEPAAASAAPADAPSSGEASSASPAGDAAMPESAQVGGSDPSPAVAAADGKNAADKPAG
jgi:sec-independent protein translocase protein TatA